MVSELLKLTSGSSAIGTASSRTLIAQSSGVVGVALPTAVPTGAAVAYQ
nr:type IV pilus biogenesis protein PilM [Pseudomonas viridiflava]